MRREQFGLTAFEPLRPLGVLTLGAMAVAAGVIRDTGIATLAAFINVAAQDRGAADFNGAHDAQLLP
jgi:hypothetical protein